LKPTLELRHVEITISSGAKIVQLPKTKAITHFLTRMTAFSGSHFSHAMQTLGNSNVPFLQNKEPCQAKTL